MLTLYTAVYEKGSAFAKKKLSVQREKRKIMIKSKDGEVKMEGTYPQIIADFTLIIDAIYEHFGPKAICIAIEYTDLYAELNEKENRS